MSDSISVEQHELTSIDGHCWQLHIAKPTQTSSETKVIACFPAMGTRASYYKPLLENLAKCGYIAAASDLRGTGNSSYNAHSGHGYGEIVRQDFPTIVQFLSERFDNSIYLLGHSLGGQLALLYAARDAINIAGIILIASCSVYFRAFNFPRNFYVLTGTQMAKYLSAILGHYPGHRLGFGGHQSRQLIRDWAHQALTGNYRLQPDHDNTEQRLKALSLPLLAISIDEDWLAPPSALDHLCNKIPSATITRWHYQPSADLEKKIDHFRWVKNNEEIIRYLERWIEKSP